MIVFLVPLISALTVNIRSYTMLMVGTAVSAGAVFLCFLPDGIALAIGDTWFGTWLSTTGSKLRPETATRSW